MDFWLLYLKFHNIFHNFIIASSGENWGCVKYEARAHTHTASATHLRPLLISSYQHCCEELISEIKSNLLKMLKRILDRTLFISTNKDNPKII